jgi:hypothetical protein
VEARFSAPVQTGPGRTTSSMEISHNILVLRCTIIKNVAYFLKLSFRALVHDNEWRVSHSPHSFVHLFMLLLIVGG